MIDDAEFHEIANVTSDGNLGSVVEERYQLAATKRAKQDIEPK